VSKGRRPLGDYMRSEWRRKLNVNAVVPYTSKHPIHEIIDKFGSRH